MRAHRVLMALVLWGLPSSTAVAVGANLRCGMVLGEQAVLDRDLVCDGPGLIVRNPRTVLQLNGHTIVSRRTCAEGAAPAGIVVERGHEASGRSAAQADVSQRTAIEPTDVLLVHARGRLLHVEPGTARPASLFSLKPSPSS